MNINSYLFLKVHNHRVEWIVMMEDLDYSVFRFYSLLSMIVEENAWKARTPIVMVCRFGRSNHSIFNISSIPRITNELEQKLYEYLPIVPI